MIVSMNRGTYVQCSCVAHQQLTEDKPRDYKRRLRQLLRTTIPLHSDTGILFAQALLELILDQLGKTNFVVQKSGSLDSVSYMLWAEDTEYNFRGFPDFTVQSVATLVLIVSSPS